jgi:hypothetical protein
LTASSCSSLAAAASFSCRLRAIGTRRRGLAAVTLPPIVASRARRLALASSSSSCRAARAGEVIVACGPVRSLESPS